MKKILTELSLASAIVTAYKVVVIGLYSQFHVFQTEVILWLASSTAADLLVTGSMVYYLQSHKTGFPSTDGTIDRIIRLTLQTGTLTAIIALVDLLLFLFLKDGIHFILNWMLINLYTISLLSSLNSRQGWHWDSSDHRPSSGPASASGQNRTRSGGREDMFTLTRPEVFIHVETHEMLSIDATADSKVQRLDLESGGAIDDERK
ncbi:hypothetical protein FISHEDRAFT_78621 [Fistulina hepatica ATCC 64428]|uniref:DUF6534 domain-containing protein n=1 Tax=Fistulina hepatica ATCC 64428 TaxID=1128425 RepID=A0A0D7A0G8_9AGAR|nr:hypothetical protein FISHEDRAFT_78621 [Fistulina hepatica ATCC 64428]